MDFVHHQFAGGRRFRILNVVDDVTKTRLDAISGSSISGRRAARDLTAIVERHSKPSMIVSDHGTEFYLQHQAHLMPGQTTDRHFIASRKFMPNDFVGSFNGPIHGELLNERLPFEPDDRPSQDAAWVPITTTAATLGDQLSHTVELSRAFTATAYRLRKPDQLRRSPVARPTIRSRTFIQSRLESERMLRRLNSITMSLTTRCESQQPNIGDQSS